MKYLKAAYRTTAAIIQFLYVYPNLFNATIDAIKEGIRCSRHKK